LTVDAASANRRSLLSAPSVADVPSAQMSGWTDDNRRAGQPHHSCDTISAVDRAFRTLSPTNGCLELVDLLRPSNSSSEPVLAW
jgi:hypothetical protein